MFGLQKPVPKVNCILWTWSMSFAFSGKPSEMRNGPNGEIQASARPVEYRNSDRLIFSPC